MVRASATRSYSAPDYQANLRSSAAVRRGDVHLIDRDSHASTTTPRAQTRRRSAALRHNSAQSLRKSWRLQRRGRKRLVVVEGLDSIRGAVAPLREIVESKSARSVHSRGGRIRWAPTGRPASGAPKIRALSTRGLRSRHVIEVVAGIGESAYESFRACARCTFGAPYVFRRSGRRPNVASVSARQGGAGESRAARANVGESPRRVGAQQSGLLRDRRTPNRDRADPHRRRGAQHRCLAVSGSV